LKTVAVIGSNSFSGQDLVDLLLAERGCRVLGISRSAEKSPLFLSYKSRKDLARFSFHQFDLNLQMPGLLELLRREQPQAIVNFAAQSEVAPSWKNPEHWFRTNAVAIAELGNFLKDQSWLERYVHISSPEVYGTCEGIVREDAPVNPSTPYAASKAAGDLFLSTLVKNFKFPLISIRGTNVYGPRQQLFKIIPRSAIYLKLGKTIELHGGGTAVKSYIHIRDVSRGELAAMEKGRPGELYHLSPDGGVEVREVVRRLCAFMGKDFAAAAKNVAERLGQDKAYVIDSSKARTELGWRPQIGLDQGLREVAAWVESNWDQVRREPLDYQHKP
jgi:dTDP-glucose 4,6-dehydratase